MPPCSPFTYRFYSFSGTNNFRISTFLTGFNNINLSLKINNQNIFIVLTYINIIQTYIIINITNNRENSWLYKQLILNIFTVAWKELTV